jgi:hypothetical protein
LHSDESNPVKFCPLSIWSQKLASKSIVDPWNASAVLCFMSLIWAQQRVLQSAASAMWPNCVMPHSFFILMKAKLVKFYPFWSQKLASKRIVDPWNASALLHAFQMGPAKGLTFCCFHHVAQLCHATQLFAF